MTAPHNNGQLPLFAETTARPCYPETAGFKSRGASAEAARRISGSVAKLRDRIVDELLKNGNSTADEMAVRLNASPLMVRPRFSELRSAGRIAPTGERRRNPSGMSATVWRATRLPMVPDAPALGGPADGRP
jgi:hypothetical protein